VEVKSELASVEATLRKLDEKVRLAPTIVNGGQGRPASVSRLVVLPSTTVARRAIARHSAVLEAALPARGSSLRAWLAEPSGSVGGLQFVAFSSQVNGGSGRTSRIRVGGAGALTS
jgi:hypothetical protein